jgi:hypothetical protein
MVARGRVENGVIVLPSDVHLPEGEEVTVLARSSPAANAHGILDIPPVSLGSALPTSTVGDDLLAEMLEGR